MDKQRHDIAIIGGGAAGLSAALVLGRARRDVVVIDDGRPRNAPAAHMQGFLSRDGMPPKELVQAGRDEIARYGVELLEDRVVDAMPSFVLTLASGRRIEAPQIVLATGVSDELPDIPGVRERWGRDLLHCPYCHGWEVRDQAIGVIGTGPDPVAHAHLLRQWSKDVVMLPHERVLTEDERASLDARDINVIDGRIERLLVSDDRLRGVALADGRTIARDALFIRPALHGRPGSPAEALGCEADPNGIVRVDPDGRTSVPGMWAAGNASNPRAQVITAAGEGSAVAIALNNQLVEREARRNR